MTTTSGPRSGNPLRFIQSQWKKLLPIAAFIMGTIGSFWISPPYTPGSDKAEALTHFAKFIVAVVVGLMILPMLKKSDKKVHAPFWGKVAAASLIAGIIAFFAYQYLLGEWTLVHNKKFLVIGSAVKPDVEEFVRNNPSMTNWELLRYAAWNPWNIWTAESILHRRLVLATMYVLFTPLFAVTMVAVAQLMQCARSKE